MRFGKAIGEARPKGAEWIIWLAVYVVVHITLDVSLAVAAADRFGRDSIVVLAKFVFNPLIAAIAAQATVGGVVDVGPRRLPHHRRRAAGRWCSWSGNAVERIDNGAW